jgi:hypothetical protein
MESLYLYNKVRYLTALKRPLWAMIQDHYCMLPTDAITNKNVSLRMETVRPKWSPRCLLINFDSVVRKDTKPCSNLHSAVCMTYIDKCERDVPKWQGWNAIPFHGNFVLAKKNESLDNATMPSWSVKASVLVSHKIMHTIHRKRRNSKG